MTKSKEKTRLFQEKISVYLLIFVFGYDIINMYVKLIPAFSNKTIIHKQTVA